MANVPISGLSALGAAPAAADLLPFVDVSDTSQAPTGTTKKMTVENLFTTIAVTTSATITGASASALAVGLNGATNPAFKVDSSTALQAAGLKVTGAVAGGTVAVAVIDSSSNANLTINAKGTGAIGIGSVSTGTVTITPNIIGGGDATINGTVIGNTKVTSGGNVQVAATGFLSFGGTRSAIAAPSDGNIILSNNNANDFGLLVFGDDAATYPALKRSSTALHVRLGDDSAYAPLVASSVTVGTAAALITTNVALNNGNGPSTGTLTNAPSAGNPTKWVPINDNGTTRYIPTWT